MGYEQSSFLHDTRKVILSEEVFARLQGLINITAFNKGMTDSSKIKHGYEYGGVLYGALDDEGNINFIVANDKADYQAKDGAFSLQSGKEMMEELLTNLFNPEFNCFAHVHTHPYSVEANRFLSDADVKYYKTTFDFSGVESQLDKKVNTFGCLLTQSSSNEPENDDVSFVYFNKEDGKMYYLPNIFVRSRNTGTLYPLKKVRERLYRRNEDGRLFNEEQYKQQKGTFGVREVERTLLDTDEFESTISPEEIGKTTIDVPVEEKRRAQATVSRDIEERELREKE